MPIFGEGPGDPADADESPGWASRGCQTRPSAYDRPRAHICLVATCSASVSSRAPARRSTTRRSPSASATGGSATVTSRCCARSSRLRSRWSRPPWWSRARACSTRGRATATSRRRRSPAAPRSRRCDLCTHRSGAGVSACRVRDGLRRRDLEELPYPAAGFDAVVSVLAVALAPRPRRTVRELVRVARPRGVVALTRAAAAVPGAARAPAARARPSARSPADWGIEEVARKRLELRLEDLELQTEKRPASCSKTRTRCWRRCCARSVWTLRPSCAATAPPPTPGTARDGRRPAQALTPRSHAEDEVALAARRSASRRPATGKLQARHAFSSHILEKKSPKRKRAFGMDRDDLQGRPQDASTKLLGGNGR